MRSKINNPANQLRWVVFLLAIAVILPTVCLLWFMSQAVKNERLAVRQKLIDFCNDKVNSSRTAFNRIDTLQNETNLNRLKGLINLPDIWLQVSAIKENADGVLIYDANDKLIYPITYQDSRTEFTGELQSAFELEQKGNYQQALEKYRQITDANNSSSYAIFAASMGTIRCLDKSEQDVNKVPDLFYKLLWANNQRIRKQFTPSQVAMIRVRRVQWLTEHKDTITDSGMYGDLDGWYTPTEAYPAETTIWALEKILKIAGEHGQGYKLDESIKRAKAVIRTEKISSACAEFFGDNQLLQDWPIEKWKAFKINQIFYAIKYSIDGKKILLIRTRENIPSLLQPYIKNLSMNGIDIRLFDNMDNLLFGPVETKNKPFTTTHFSNQFPDWRLELHFKDNSVFEDAASKQTAIYIWTGVLVVLLILTSGALATQAIDRQIKLNKLKNDFIATVTHELKTPLSSMRVLVDTLLEGRCENQQQQTEYLQLISKENVRLSRLIDNFLTFSRMERNKQAFDFAPVNPAEIAKAAVEAVQTKFNKENCKFTVTIDENLPSITADKDAMVTVLVNLLDNAYKYSNETKEIELKSFTENNLVYFAVKDNGIGMTHRQTKKIFDRFYQADTSLARRAEGTGLGLSIVKFIVDAHKGKIDVESKSGKGSIFTVILPVIKT